MKFPLLSAVIAAIILPLAGARAQSVEQFMRAQQAALRQFSRSAEAVTNAMPSAPLGPPPTQPYVYTYDGQPVALRASRHYALVRGWQARLVPLRAELAAQGLNLDPRGDTPVLRERDLTLLRVQLPTTGGRVWRDALEFVLETLERVFALGRGESVSVLPVFEDGAALLLPADETIVGFKSDTSLWQARARLRQWDERSIADVAPLRPNTFLVRHRPGAILRAFEAATRYQRQADVSFAEPNLMILDDRLPPALESVVSRGRLPGPDIEVARGSGRLSPPRAAEAHAWVELARLDGEGDLPPGWWIATSAGAAQAWWGTSELRAFAGRRAWHVAGDGPLARPDGPCPTNLATFLISPDYDFSDYAEVFIECRFHARNEMRGNAARDAAFIIIETQGLDGSACYGLASPHVADLTLDPDTDRGWRRMLVRVPTARLQPGTRVSLTALSDDANPTPGTWVDEFRIMARRAIPPSTDGNDPALPRQWALRNTGQIAGLGDATHSTGIADAWGLTSVSTALVVAVVDQGVDPRHPDLNLRPGLRHDGTPGGAPETKDDNHGTPVAGVVGARRDNGIGGCGAAPGVSILPVHFGDMSFAHLAQALDSAVAGGARIINGSWGAGVPSKAIEEALRDATARGCVVVLAAGNGPARETAFPARLTDRLPVIAVGAVSPTDEPKSASSSDGEFGWTSAHAGPGPDLCAPGTAIFCADRTGPAGYSEAGAADPDHVAALSGTSFAAPLVAGVAALMLSANPDLTPADVKRLLMDSADDMAPPGRDERSGAGRVNAVRAVTAARAAPRAGGSAGADQVSYTYIYDGRPVTLTPAPARVAVRLPPGDRTALLSRAGLRADPADGHPALLRAGLTLVAIEPGALTNAAAGRGFYVEAARLVGDLLRAALGLRGGEEILAQPVFELGGALAIPTDEVIVGFDAPTSMFQARGLFQARAADAGIVETEQLRPDAVLTRVRGSGHGRVFAVAGELAALPGVAYAEPNPILILHPPADLPTPRLPPYSDRAMQTVAGRAGTTGAPAATTNGWVTLAALDFEDEATPLPPGWTSAFGVGYTKATWGRTSHRAQSGRGALYCAAAGEAAVTAPGPAPARMLATLRSPEFDLSGYDEVYLDLWFHAINESDNRQVKDGATIVLLTPGRDPIEFPLATPTAADLTQDPTTDRGWRRGLFRVPPAARRAGAVFICAYLSDARNPTAGVTVDELRIVAARGLAANPPTDDPHAARAWALRNTGQIAGLGAGHDLRAPEAWAQALQANAPVAADLIVAVLDNGVDLKHPDLNLASGYAWDGRAGGGPIGADDNHGTAVAGALGARRDNRLGLTGMAPGVTIMPVHTGFSLLSHAQAIRLAAERGARILNNSWGWVGMPSMEVTRAIEAALGRGCHVLFAAGNGPDRPPYTYEVAFPASLTRALPVICVGAAGPSGEYKGAASSDGAFMWGSSYVGAGPDVCAPGPWVFTTDRLGAPGYNRGDFEDPDYWNAFTGTSAACPLASGVVALMLSVNPGLSPAEVKRILRETAEDMDAPGDDDRTGMGFINAARAVRAARERATP